MSTQHTLPNTRAWLAMPTLVGSLIASLALVIAVGLQAPAVSVGLRWKPGPRSQGFELPHIEGLGFDWPAFNNQPRSLSPWVTWLLIALITVALLMLLVRWIRNRSTRATNIARVGADGANVSEADAQILQSGLAAAIQMLSANDRDRGNAVVQAWQSLQDAAAEAGLHRHPAETTSEFTARILYRSRRSAEPIAGFLSLYQRVRFGEHAPHSDEIASARQALITLVDLWQADFPKRRAPIVTLTVKR